MSFAFLMSVFAEGLRAPSLRSHLTIYRPAVFSGFLDVTHREGCPMQNIRPALGPGAYTVAKTTMRTPADARTSTRAETVTSPRSIDFSRVTPRQLQSYVNDMIKSDRMTVKDGTALTQSIPREWYTHRPDVSVDIASNMRGAAASARGHGAKPLAAFYDGLMDRMKLMEAQGVPISVVA